MSELEKALIDALLALIDARIVRAVAAEVEIVARRTLLEQAAEAEASLAAIPGLEIVLPPAEPPSRAIDLGEGFSYEVEE